MTQYAVCKFRREDKRGYTYRNDGAPVKIGDVVRVPARGNDPDAWQRVTVSEILFDAPAYECKPILGLAPPRDPHEPERPSSPKDPKSDADPGMF